MKQKNLEKAVLLTVMLMSLHSNVYAADTTIDADSNPNRTQTITSSGSGNTTTVIGAELTVTTTGTTVSATNGGTINFTNTNTIINATSSSNMNTVNVVGGSKVSTDDNSGLTINVTGNSSNANMYRGIWINGASSSLNVGRKGAVITVTGQTASSGVAESTAIDNRGGSFTATGDLDIDMELTADYSKKVQANTSGIASSGTTIIKDADINITVNGNDDTNTLRLNEIKGVNFTGGTFTADNLTIIAAGDAEITGISAEAAVSNQMTVNNKVYVKATGDTRADGITVKRSKFTTNEIELELTSDNTAVGLRAEGTGKIEFVNGTITAKVNSESPKASLATGINSVNGNVKSTGKLIISATGVPMPTTESGVNWANSGVYNQSGTIDLNEVEITTSTIDNLSNNSGIHNTSNGKVMVKKLTVTSDTGINNETNGTVTVDNLNAEVFEGIANNGSNVTVNEQAVFKNAKYIMRSWTNGTKTEFKKDFITQGDGDNLVMVLNGSTADINSSEAGLVQFTGSLRQDGAAFGNYTDGTINMNLTTEGSYWNLNDDSTLNTLKNNTIVDMTADKGKFSTLNVNTLDGTGDIKMDIDADKNTGNSDRLYVDTLNGTQNIILNGINNNESKAAVGTVLASVNNGNGKFIAKDVEGALYWNSFELDKQTSADGNYKDDWYISNVELNETGGDDGGNTTSVDTILGANALNYHTWRAENDQLMRRMGELRNNNGDEQGAWFRVHGSKISHDDIAGFENKYTTYELGYDQLTKETKDMVRYTGAALSYTDGSSSYDSGNGENHSKALSFYNTDLYRSGHYLDLVFKYANMDNDFSVFDTAGQKITGEYKNTGISVSAEYGRKNELKHGWYVEPQAQLTLGYFGGDEYETSNGISVDQSGIASVLGRVGFNIGRELGNSGVIYAKANLLHEFAGDYDIDMYDGAGNHRAESASFNDTWFEYGAGAALKTGKNNHLYFDFVKTAGGDFEKDWQWNAGMRWTF